MPKLRSWFYRGLYWYLDKLDKEHHLHFMNYGFAELHSQINIDDDDEVNRYPIQLYHHVASQTDLKGKRIVEVGSGRGGGLAYVTKTFSPLSAIGIDIEKSAVAFSNMKFRKHNLEYKAGNAEKLPLADESCDVVLNVESSHRYLSMEAFLNEVRRILLHEGYLLFTDFRQNHEWQGVTDHIDKAGLKIIVQKDITENIIHSLDRDSERREELIRNFAPKIFQKGMLNFSGARGTETYENFLKRKFIYKSFLIQKTRISRQRFYQ